MKWRKTDNKKQQGSIDFHDLHKYLESHPLTEERVGIRLLHAAECIKDEIDVYVNGKRMTRNISFGFITPYVQIPTGDNWIQLYKGRGKKSLILSQVISVRGGAAFTLLFMEKEEIGHLIVIPDRHPNEVCKVHIRFLNFSPDTPHVDLVDQQGVCLFRNIPFTEITAYRSFDPGERRLAIQVSGTNQILYRLPSFYFPEQYVITIIAVGSRRLNSYRVEMIKDR